MGGIRCARCGSDNAGGSRFCGVCGVRLGTVPPTEPRAGSDAEAAGPPQVTAARVRRARETPDVSVAEDAIPPSPTAGDGDERPWPPPLGLDAAGGDGDRARASLDGSLQLPARAGSRGAAIALVLALDAALVVAGVFLWREARRPVAIAGDAGVVAVVTADAGVTSAVAVIDAAAAPPRRPPVVAPSPSGGGRPSSGPSPGGGAGSSPPADARSLDDLLGRRDAGPAPEPDAAPAPADAPPAPPDAPPGPARDAAGPLDPYEAAAVDAGAIEPDAEEPEAGVVDAADAVARLSSRHQQRFQRCYRQAAKAYPPEQPLEGEVDIALRVMPTGEVREVSAVRNTTGSETLAQCLVAVIAGWRVAAGGAEPIDLVRPFRFGASP